MSIVSYFPKRSDRRYKSPAKSQKLAFGRGRQETRALGKLLIGITPLVLMLSSCQAFNSSSQGRWTTYRNPRYGFEFPYPSNWVPFPIPDNRDGRIFRDPYNSSVEIRGWAANNLTDIQAPSHGRTPKDALKSQQPNFTTTQGVIGKLQVEVGSDTSLITLTLSQGKVLYNWQGQCSNKQFADYYRFFSYVASQYRLPSQSQKL